MAKASMPADPVDLNQFDAMVQAQDEGVLVPIYQPMANGRTAPLGFAIKIAGPDSERAREALESIQRDLVDEGSIGPPTKAEQERARLRYFAKVTMDFVPLAREDGTTPDIAVKLDGKPLVYTEENATKLYQRFRFILQQVQTKADTRSAFLAS